MEEKNLGWCLVSLLDDGFLTNRVDPGDIVRQVEKMIRLSLEVSDFLTAVERKLPLGCKRGTLGIQE
jgi:hypothetical protein